MEQITIRAQLLGKESRNGYTSLAFQNLDTNQYMICTLLPNWDLSDLNIGQIGFLEVRHVIAGDVWLDPNTFNTNRYKYSGIYLNKFVPITHIIDGNKIQKTSDPIYIS